MTYSWPPYETAMFANQERSAFSDLFYGEMIAHHEAGHAVAGYALGIGTHYIQMRTMFDLDQNLMSPHGCWMQTKQDKCKHNRLSRKWERGKTGLDRYFVLQAVATAAGIAAEYKYCEQENLPHRSLFGSDGDHEYIDTIDKRLSMWSGRNGFSFRRLIWQKTKRLLDRPEIWNAICEVASPLSMDYEPERDETATGNHSSFCNMPGSVARSIMHSCGVRKGMALSFI